MIIINKDTNKTYVFEEPNKIAYDGCHKIYICEDDEDLKEDLGQLSSKYDHKVIISIRKG